MHVRKAVITLARVRIDSVHTAAVDAARIRAALVDVNRAVRASEAVVTGAAEAINSIHAVPLTARIRATFVDF